MQPGLFQSQPSKSMRENFVPFISFTAPRQFHLPGQSLHGLRADAHCVMVLHPRQFNHDAKFHCRLLGLAKTTPP